MCPVSGVRFLDRVRENPYRLRDRLDASSPGDRLYRIWYEDDILLAYIGESSNIPGHSQT